VTTTLKGYTSPLNIIECMEHEQLFGQWFKGESWNGWKAVLRAAYCLPMTPEEITFFKSISGDRDPPTKRVRELWVCGGRRSGKDSVASLIVAYSAALFNGQANSRPGEKACCALLACDRSQAGIVAGYIRSYFENIPPFQAMVTRETMDGLELSNAVNVVVATNSYRSLRGFAILNGTLDECAFYMDETTARSDVATYNALKPGTVTVDGMIVGISTPHKKSGLLFNKWKQHFGKNDPDVLVIQSPSRTLNPTLPAEVVEQALADDPVAAAAEWLAEWRDDISGFVTMEVLDACTDRNVSVRPPQPGCRYVGFVDASSGSGKDSFAVAVAHGEKDGKVILDLAHERRPPFNPSSAIEEAAILLKSYRITSVQGDKYAANFVIEGFAKHGIKYSYSEHDRSQVYLECLPLLTSGRARLVDSKRMLSQFASLERRSLSSGRDVVDHPAGDRHHDDLSNACAGALKLAVGRKPMIVRPEHMEALRARAGAEWGGIGELAYLRRQRY
jgi:hypothetical protein